MSSAMGPSSQALDNLGSAIGNLGLTIAGKLDDAERASQYNNGQEILRRNMNDFMLKLQSDPNTDGYNEKLSKAESDWWGQIDKTVKHQGAKNDLQAWYMAQRDSVEQSVGQQAINVRGNKILGTATENTNTLMNEVASGAIDPNVAKGRLREFWKPLQDSLLVDPSTMANHYDAWDAQINTFAVTNGAMAAMKPANPGDVPNYQAAHDWLMDPKNTVGLSEVQVNSIDNKINQLETIQDKRDTRANDKTEVDLSKEYSNVILNDLPPTKLKQLIDAARPSWVGKEKSARDYTWAQRFRSIVDYQEAQARVARSEQTQAKADRGGYDTEVANTLQTLMYNPDMTTESKLDAITKAMASQKDATGKMLPPQITTQDGKRLAASIKDSSTVIHDSALRLQGLSAKDANGNPGPLTADDVKVGQAMLQEMVDKSPTLIPSQIADETDRIAIYLQQGAMRKAIATAFARNTKALVTAEQQVAGFGPIAKTTEGQKVITAIRTEQVAELKARGVDAQPIGVDQLNRTIFRAANGNTYYQDVVNGQPVWKVKTGWNPAWVILK